MKIQHKALPLEPVDEMKDFDFINEVLRLCKIV